MKNVKLDTATVDLNQITALLDLLGLLETLEQKEKMVFPDLQDVLEHLELP